MKFVREIQRYIAYELSDHCNEESQICVDYLLKFP